MQKPTCPIISHQRSGAGLLHSYLRSHPEIWSNGLVKRSSEIELIHQRRLKPPIKYTAFNLLFEYESDERNELINLIADTQRPAKVLHLYRGNLLRVWTSQKLAEKTNQWKLLSAKKRIPLKQRTVHINIEECLIALQKLEAQEARVMARLQHLEVMKVSYEQLVASPKSTLIDIQHFLDTSIYAMHTPMYKQNPEPLSMLIENYNQVRRSLAPTRWASFLAEESRFY